MNSFPISLECSTKCETLCISLSLEKENKIITTHNMPVSEEAKPLFEFLIKNGYIIDIENYDEKFVKTV
ncbi:Uncharacterised protein [Sphingobacterium multivorum]|uniref:Uncharacterized protein n=1 Tax=Sphingobacterium multivorum TaxID=28454 RepID=A0A2X2J1E8_SPHMU|nr:Uncharacterised protein [Sphingobacterium multivorum]